MSKVTLYISKWRVSEYIPQVVTSRDFYGAPHAIDTERLPLKSKSNSIPHREFEVFRRNMCGWELEIVASLDSRLDSNSQI